MTKNRLTVVGVIETGVHRVFNVIIETKDKIEKMQVIETDLVKMLSTNQITGLNVQIGNGKAIGNSGSLERFKGNKKNSPLVVLDTIVDERKEVMGYVVADKDGEIKRLQKQVVIDFCKQATKVGDIPVQNAKFIDDNSERQAHLVSLGEPFNKIEIKRRENKNAKPAEIKKKESPWDLFSEEQKEQIRLFSKTGADMRLIANHKLSPEQMKEIRTAVEQGLNARLFASPEFSVSLMRFYKAELRGGNNIRPYLNPKFSISQLLILSIAYLEGVDMSKIADPKIPALEMSEIKLRLSSDIWKNVPVIVDKSWGRYENLTE